MNNNDHIYENIVFEGGGVKGIALPGAIKILNNAGILKNIKRFGGSSIGSMFAAFLALNIEPEKLINLATNIDLASLKSQSCTVNQIWKLIFNYGLASNNRILNLVLEAFKELDIDPDVTFNENFKKTGNELYVSSTNINTQMVHLFSHNNRPDMKISQAVSMSMCVPIYYNPFEYGGDYWVDGGVAENYPIYIFNDLDKLKDGLIYDIDKSYVNPKTIGVKLLVKNESNTFRTFNGRNRTANIFTIIKAMIDTLTRQIEMSDVTESYINQTIPIPDLNLGMLEVDISTKKRKEMIEKGKIAAINYLKKNKLVEDDIMESIII